MFKSFLVFLTLFPVFSYAAKYDNVVLRLEKIAQSNPSQVQIFILGNNDQGVPIKGLKIGNGLTNSLVVATHHGNEYGSTEVGLGFAEHLAKAPIKDQTVYVIPVLNISGYNLGRREETLNNARIDSNRDYSGPCKFGANFKLKSTSLIAQFLEDKNIIISATLHTHFPAVLYPWGISTRDTSTPHDNEYMALTKAAAIESGYQYGNNTELLYPADGTFEDYAYWKHGIWSLLFELGFSHNPDAQSVINMVQSNNPGIKRFLELAPKQRATNFKFTGKCDFSKSVNQRIFLE